MLPAPALFTALSCVSGVTVVTQKPPVLTLTQGQTATMDCNLGTVTNYEAGFYKQVPGGVPHTSLQSLLYLLLTLIISSLSTRVPSHTDTMLPAPALFTALSCVSGVTVVTQKPPVLTLTQGQTATMDCNLGTVTNSAARFINSGQFTESGDAKPSVRTQEKGNTVTMDCNIAKDESNYVSWYKQIPQEAPQFVLRFYHSHSSPDLYGDNFSSTRFTSKASTNIDYQLIIRNVEVGDSAVYYCGTWDSSAKEAEVYKSHSGVFGQRRGGGFADVRWLVNGNPVTSGVITGSAQQQANKKFSLSSYLTIDSSEWENDKVITCEVSAGGKAASVKIKKSECSE
ncbi:hypothetical protein HF521_013775 [Silurus meridionalis]|uniref:Ig-like domain-containing protein n=1 Tax=Silurus meridionalis TaxID=175797 RepID=A0A8T0AAP2_SILME|nr:hypothetical protein HF521_013775 [Silurus meridionalis]